MSTAESQPPCDAHQRMPLMGVADCAKTAVGKSLAARLGVRHFDGEDLHPPESTAKMSRCEPLDDADRWPRLSRIARPHFMPTALLANQFAPLQPPGLDENAIA